MTCRSWTRTWSDVGSTGQRWWGQVARHGLAPELVSQHAEVLARDMAWLLRLLLLVLSLEIGRPFEMPQPIDRSEMAGWGAPSSYCLILQVLWCSAQANEESQPERRWDSDQQKLYSARTTARAKTWLKLCPVNAMKEFSEHIFTFHKMTHLIPSPLGNSMRIIYENC